MEQQKLAELVFRNNYEGHAIEKGRKELFELMHREEMMWRQRVKNDYIKEGDRNTKYFHIIASKRRCNNFIIGINDEMGVWQQEPKTIEDVLLRYFTYFSYSIPSDV